MIRRSCKYCEDWRLEMKNNPVETGDWRVTSQCYRYTSRLFDNNKSIFYYRETHIALLIALQTLPVILSSQDV